VLGESVEEAEAIYKKDKKQIFYFDDFLGRNYLGALGRHEDSRIVGFIRRIQSDATKRFVLTTRTVVLNQAKVLSDQFDIAKVNRTELEIRVENLDHLDRAHILHKHVWHSDLSAELVVELLASRRYLEVVKHPNFNPRLIQFITDAQRYDQDHAAGYWIYVRETLANPVAVWRHVLENQLDDYSRVLLLLCCFNGRQPIGEPVLQAAFAAFKDEPVARDMRGNSEFTRNSRLVSGSVLSRVIGIQHAVVYTLFSPSVADYVYVRYAGDAPLLTAVFCSLSTCDSLRTLKDLVAHGFFAPNVATEILSALMKRCIEGKETDADYRVMLLDIVASLSAAPSDLQSLLTQLANTALRDLNDKLSVWETFATLMIKLLQVGLVSDDELVRAFQIFDKELVEEEELEAMAELYVTLGRTTQSAIEPKFKRQVLSYWQESINDLLDRSGTLDGFLSEDETDEVSDVAEQYIQEKLDFYPLEFTHSEVKSVTENVDVWGFISANQRRESRGFYGGRETASSPAVTDEVIVDLFDIDLPR
jgi:hypothetical protein